MIDALIDALTPLLPILAALASAGGSGRAASQIYDWVRTEFPRPTLAEYQAAPPLARRMWAMVHAPRQARWNVFALSIVLALGSSTLLGWLTGHDPASAFAAALAVVISQVLHGRTLATTLAFDPPPVSVSPPPPPAPQGRADGNRAMRRQQARQQRRGA